jgi:hypothetical protein
MKRLVAVLGALVAIAVAVLLWKGRAGERSGAPAVLATEPAARAVAGPRLLTVHDVPALPSDSRGPRQLPPPPPDFHEGPMQPVHRSEAARLLAEGEFPVRPPAFVDPADRAAFRAWWIDEYERRVQIFREHNPSEDFPSEEETAHLVEKFYDLGEPPLAGEGADDYEQRQQEWFETWRDLTAAFGTPPMTVLSFGADPQYGSGAPPPVVPEGGEPLEPDTTRPMMSDDGVPREERPLGPAGRR